MNFQVKTTIQDQVIVQEVHFDCGLNETVSKIRHQVIDLQEEGIRKALMLLGWTPPKEMLDSPTRPM